MYYDENLVYFMWYHVQYDVENDSAPIKKRFPYRYRTVVTYMVRLLGLNLQNTKHLQIGKIIVQLKLPSLSPLTLK